MFWLSWQILEGFSHHPSHHRNYSSFTPPTSHKEKNWRGFTESTRWLQGMAKISKWSLFLWVCVFNVFLERIVVISPFFSTCHISFFKGHEVSCGCEGVLIPAKVLITIEVRVTQACCGLGVWTAVQELNSPPRHPPITICSFTFSVYSYI